MEKNLGLGVMIGLLSRGDETVNVVRNALGKKIKDITMINDYIILEMEDGYKFQLWDNGQSCCERRYMTCDDNIKEFIGATLLNINTKDAPDINDGEVHEVQFLEFDTDRGAISVASHNEHNGYYGGFCIEAQQVK